jgi:hypothetical protein
MGNPKFDVMAHGKGLNTLSKQFVESVLGQGLSAKINQQTATLSRVVCRGHDKPLPCVRSDTRQRCPFTVCCV